MTGTRREGQSTLRALFDSNLGQFASQGIGVLRVLLVARLLSPDVLGAYAALVLLFTYGTNIHAGLFDGALRLAPRLRGEGKDEEARTLLDSAFTTTLAMAALLWFGVLLTAFVLDLSTEFRLGMLLVALAVVLQQVVLFVNLPNRIRMRLDRVRNASILRAVVEFAVTVGLASTLGLLALPLGLVAGLLASATWLILTGFEHRLRLRFSPGLSRRALSFGVPVLLGGLGMTLLMSLDRVLILHFLDVRRMGYYVLGAQLGSVVYTVPTVVASVLYIRFLQVYGEHRSDPTAVLGRADEALRGTGVLSAFLAGGGLALTVPLAIVLPDFAPGMDAVRVALVGFAFLGVSSMANNLLVAVDRSRWLLVAQVVAALVLAGLGAVGGATRGTLVAVALAITAGFATYATLLLAAVDARCAGRLRPLGWLRTYLPVLVVTAASALVFRYVPTATGLAEALGIFTVHGLLVVAVLVPFALPVVRARRRAGWGHGGGGPPKQRPKTPEEDP